MMRTLVSPLVVCVCYPPDAGEALFARVRAVDPRVEVLAVPYEEPAALRTAKRRGEWSDALAAQTPRLGDAERVTLARAEVILALDVPRGLDELAPRLRWIQSIGAGIGHYDEPALERRKIRLTTAAGTGAAPIAEFVLARVLEVWKDLPRLASLQREQRWEFAPGRMLASRTLAIVGLGAIGVEVARRARGFGVHLIGIRNRYREGDTSPYVDEVRGADALHEVLARADVVVLAAPETERTKGLMDRAAFAAMKPGSVLVNVARGTLVDEEALLEALRSGQLRAAILDVVREEPLPPGSPLWSAPNVYLSGHSAVSPDGYIDRVLDLFTANLRCYLDGEALRNEVDFSAGY